MEAIPRSDIKSVIRFDISTKRTTWIGQLCQHIYTVMNISKTGHFLEQPTQSEVIYGWSLSLFQIYDF